MIEVDGLKLNANIKKQKDEVIITGSLEGEVEVECIKCLKPFKKRVKEDLNLKVVKPPYEGFDNKYDIIEQENFDLKEIVRGEIESIKSDYNICPNCEKIDFNKEI